jgi:hypothetical protein
MRAVMAPKLSTGQGVLTAPATLAADVARSAIVSQPEEASLPVLALGEWRVELFLRRWVDATADVRGVSTSRGSRTVSGITRRTEAGTVTVELLNRARQWDPTANTDFYTGVPLRLTVSNGSAMVPVFTGRVVDIELQWRSYGMDPVVTVTAADAVSVLSQMDLAAVTAVGAGETASARITRILDAAGWPVGDRDISGGGVALAATTLEGSVWDQVGTVVDAEVGDCWVRADGVVAFRTFAEALNGASAMTFADDGTGVAYADVAMVYDDEQLLNRVIYALAGSPTVTTLSDTGSAGKYTGGLFATLTATDLPFSTQASADAWAQLALYIGADPELRVDTVTLLPRGDTSMVAALLALEIASKVTVIINPMGGGTITQSCWVRGISHEVTADRVWRCTLSLQSGSRYRYFTLDDVVLGQLDSWALAEGAGTWSGGRWVTTAGQVPTRTEWNRLADQMVMVFPSLAVAQSVITSPTVGMQVQIVTPFERRYWNGSSWAKA